MVSNAKARVKKSILNKRALLRYPEPSWKTVELAELFWSARLNYGEA